MLMLSADADVVHCCLSVDRRQLDDHLVGQLTNANADASYPT